jgi:hypothetical protein
VTRFAKHHGIGLIQPELDFVDIPMDGDLPVFVDPFGISLCDDELGHTCNDELVSFFQTVISAIRSGDDALAERMLQRLSEPNETHLGVSKGRPQGRGISGKQAHDLYRSIASSKAAKSGLVSELSECDLFIDGIGADKISDITTNIIRRHLIAYTQRQCELHNIELRHRVSSGFMWDEDRRIWREVYTFLPSYKGQRLLLVPKVFVRRRPALESQEYLEHHVLTYLQAEHLQAGSALVEVFKNGRRRVTKTSLKQNYSCSKEWMAQFSAEHLEVLENYKAVSRNLVQKERQREADFLNDGIDETVFARALIETLAAIPAGNDTASKFHNLMIGIIEFLFWPSLTNPVKEQEIHDGRKRIDIMFDNSGRDGLFGRILSAPQTASIRVPVECKNYSKDPANPELDQIAGRFAPNRGWVGFMVYRQVSDYELLLKRCRDTAVEKRGFVIPLGDTEIRAMLQDVANSRRPNIDHRLTDILNRITN